MLSEEQSRGNYGPSPKPSTTCPAKDLFDERDPEKILYVQDFVAQGLLAMEPFKGESLPEVCLHRNGTFDNGDTQVPSPNPCVRNANPSHVSCPCREASGKRRLRGWPSWDANTSSRALCSHCLQMDAVVCHHPLFLLPHTLPAAHTRPLLNITEEPCAVLGWRAVEMGWQQNNHWDKEAKPHPAVELGCQPLLPLGESEAARKALLKLLQQHEKGSTTSSPPAGILDSGVHWMSFRSATLYAYKHCALPCAPFPSSVSLSSNPRDFFMHCTRMLASPLHCCESIHSPPPCVPPNWRQTCTSGASTKAKSAETSYSQQCAPGK